VLPENSEIVFVLGNHRFELDILLKTDGIRLGFETFRAWWRDPAQRVDLNSVNIEDIPCTAEATRRLLSLGREEMPDAAGIAKFDYRPPAPEPEAAEDDGEAREAPENVEATPTEQDPLSLLRGSVDNNLYIFFFVQFHNFFFFL
jgi:hypothetical protein